MVFHFKTVESSAFRSFKRTECPQATHKEVQDLVLVSKIEVKIIQTRDAKVLQNPYQNGSKWTHIGFKNEAPRGTPSTFGGHFRGFWGSWRSWAAKCVLGGVLGRSWVGLGRVLGPSWGPSSASWKRLGCPRRPKNFAKTVQDASKMPPRQPKIRFSAKK